MGQDHTYKCTTCVYYVQQGDTIYYTCIDLRDDSICRYVPIPTRDESPSIPHLYMDI